MVDAMGWYSPWNTRRKVTPTEIKKMRENMQKVPRIQEKAEEYHHQQATLADEVLESQLIKKNTQPDTDETEEGILEPKKERSTLWAQLWRRIIDKFS